MYTESDMYILKTLIDNITLNNIKGNFYIFILNIFLIFLPIILFGLPNWFNDKACYILC